MSDFSPGAPLCKLLFGRATGCAHPDCPEPLVEEHCGLLSVNVKVAHIRAEKPGGARHDPAFTKENGRVNSEENLMLLCHKHHKWVDAHEDAYPTDELLAWKKRQITESRSAGLSASQLDRVVAAFTTPRADVEVVGVLRLEGEDVTTKIEAFGKIGTTPAHSAERLLGVRTSNVGAIGFTLNSAGIEIDVDGPAPVIYLYPRGIVRHLEPHAVALWAIDALRDPLGIPFSAHTSKGPADGVWHADPSTLAAGIRQAVIPKGWVPLRFRAFANFGPDNLVHGSWVPAVHLPIWEPHVTQNWLETMAETAKRWREGGSQAA
ncbi:HNH endonuclease [Streptomyces cinereoruber]|uniref:HNH endonuclease n=1 Tax=Streptomyces cinereoruber TaxID=67260 RepID=UPI003C306EF3